MENQKSNKQIVLRFDDELFLKIRDTAKSDRRKLEQQIFFLVELGLEKRELDVLLGKKR